MAEPTKSSYQQVWFLQLPFTNRHCNLCPRGWLPFKDCQMYSTEALLSSINCDSTPIRNSANTLRSFNFLTRSLGVRTWFCLLLNLMERSLMTSLFCRAHSLLGTTLVLMTCYRSVGVWSEGQEEARKSKEDVDDTSGEGEQECWFGEGECHELSKMESGSWRDCC